MLTGCFTRIEPNEKADHAHHHQSKAKEVEVGDMFTQSTTTVGIYIKEHENYGAGNTASRPFEFQMVSSHAHFAIHILTGL
jgi:hypothetical protein